jgi:gluconate kinase
MKARLSAREHFMPASLLQSQYADLSLPDGVLDFDASMPVDTLVDAMCRQIEHVSAAHIHA